MVMIHMVHMVIILCYKSEFSLKILNIQTLYATWDSKVIIES